MVQVYRLKVGFTEVGHHDTFHRNVTNIMNVLVFVLHACNSPSFVGETGALRAIFVFAACVDECFTAPVYKVQGKNETETKALSFTAHIYDTFQGRVVHFILFSDSADTRNEPKNVFPFKCRLTELHAFSFLAPQVRVRFRFRFSAKLPFRRGRIYSDGRLFSCK